MEYLHQVETTEFMEVIMSISRQFLEGVTMTLSILETIYKHEYTYTVTTWVLVIMITRSMVTILLISEITMLKSSYTERVVMTK